MPVDGLRIGVIRLNVVAKGAEKRASRGDVDRRERALEGVGQGRPHLGINLSQALSDLLRQGPPAQVSLHQLADDVVAVGRAPAVSADKELAAVREAPDEKVKRFFYFISADGERRIPSQQLLQVTLHDGECSIMLQGWATSQRRRNAPRDRITGVRRKATIAYRDVFSSYIYVPNRLDEKAQYFHISFLQKKLW
jgi:hypothetical protein